MNRYSTSITRNRAGLIVGTHFELFAEDLKDAMRQLDLYPVMDDEQAVSLSIILMVKDNEHEPDQTTHSNPT